MSSCRYITLTLVLTHTVGKLSIKELCCFWVVFVCNYREKQPYIISKIPPLLHGTMFHFLVDIKDLRIEVHCNRFLKYFSWCAMNLKYMKV